MQAASLEVRARRAARAATEGGSITVVLPGEQDHLPLRPQDQHLPPLGQRRGHAGRRRERQARRAEERDRDADALRAAQRRLRKNRRLEADIIGTGKAWIATNGQTIKGTWRKKRSTEPTQFFDADGNAGHADRRPDVHPGHSRPARR